MDASTAIAGAALIAVGVVCIFLANYQYWELRFEVNSQLPEQQKFEPLLWTPVAYLKFRDLRKRVLPNSPRPKRALRLALAGFVLFLAGLAFLMKTEF
jgi:hypothetical protein